MYCTHCGNIIDQNSHFCVSCGKKVKRNSWINFKHILFRLWGNNKKIISTFIVIVFILIIINSASKSTSENNITSPTNNGDYMQEKNSLTVVNIFCPSIISEEESSGGSGTIISKNGIILTNSHIIPQDRNKLHVGESGCLVVLPDINGQASDFYLARPIVLNGVSEKYDLAFLSIYAPYYDDLSKEYAGVYPRDFPIYECENDNVRLGEPVRVFGYPEISGGYSLTVTDGLVSSLPGDGLIYTSAKISHGNSGGLAVDKNGCMIGVPSLVSTDENESLGIIYSMDLINEFANRVEEIIN